MMESTTVRNALIFLAACFFVYRYYRLKFLSRGDVTSTLCRLYSHLHARVAIGKLDDGIWFVNAFEWVRPYAMGEESWAGLSDRSIFRSLVRNIRSSVPKGATFSSMYKKVPEETKLLLDECLVAFFDFRQGLSPISRILYYLWFSWRFLKALSRVWRKVFLMQNIETKYKNIKRSSEKTWSISVIDSDFRMAA